MGCNKLSFGVRRRALDPRPSETGLLERLRGNRVFSGRSSINHSNRAVFDVGQSMRNFGRQWERIRQTVAACPQYDNLQPLPGEILLETHIAIHCDKHLKASFLVLAQAGVARSHLDPMSVDRLDEPAPRQRNDPLRCRIFMPLSDPSLRELSDHDVSCPFRQPVDEDRLHAFAE